VNWIKNGKAIVVSFVLTLLIASVTSLAFGHNFSSNESAIFLALINEIKAQAQLVQENLLNNNISLANEHATKASTLVTDTVNNEISERNQRLADDLENALTTLETSTQSNSSSSMASEIDFIVSDLDGILDEIVTARIDPDQLNNSTIQALTIVELLDKVLSNYGDAYEVRFDMTNMSMMTSMMNSSNNNDSMDSMPSNGMDNDSTSINNASAAKGIELVNITSYQTAQVLASKVQELFNSLSTDSSLTADSKNVDQAINNITAALQELVDSIKGKASPMEIMTIVHTRVHPNFITAFGLQIS